MSATLTVRFDSTSQLLKSLLRADVRDSALRLVGSAHHGVPLLLAPGFYRVDSVLEDGTVLRRVVSLAEGQHEQITLTKTPIPPSIPASAPPQYVSVDGFESLVFGGPTVGFRTPLGGDHEPRLIRVQGAQETQAAAGVWSFRTDGSGAALATFEGGHRRWTVSLPVLTGGFSSSQQPDECTVRIDGARGARAPAARIAAWRTVASSVQEMLLQFRIEQVLAIADEATTALAAKYSDPAGAALGALLLYRVDRLAPLNHWLANLARSFPWLVDARILQAGLAARSGDVQHRENGLRSLLACVHERALFTESHSLLLNLLRRWPDDALPESREAALLTLADRYANVDWSALTLTTSQPLP
jgi:hypothetical protein